MVKGISRRVVVVRPDEHGVFEQAIFLVRGLHRAAQRCGARGLPHCKRLSDRAQSTAALTVAAFCGGICTWRGGCKRHLGGALAALMKKGEKAAAILYSIPVDNK